MQRQTTVRFAISSATLIVLKVRPKWTVNSAPASSAAPSVRVVHHKAISRVSARKHLSGAQLTFALAW
ncbi:hypothetical protein U91I_00059 [alpha proteobacterium U9-1i]|nr:hypothetical protein U91I_00059 [alpha proteobacterium U9-1i]